MQTWQRAARRACAVAGLVALGCVAPSTAWAVPAAGSPSLVPYFQALEQSLADAIGRGNRVIWDRAMDDGCVVTTEEGQILTKAEFLKTLRPFPPGLAGGITVRDLTVQAFRTFAVIRYLDDEWEQVFGQRLTTKYRTTDTFLHTGSDWKLVASETAVVTSDPPAQQVDTSHWPGFVGTYRLKPNGWTFHVALRAGRLYGGLDPGNLQPFIPLAPDAFVLHKSLGDWIFVVGPRGTADRIVELRKFEPIVWSRVTKP